MNDATGPLAFRNLLSGLLRAPLRFPVTLLCSLGWALVSIARKHGVAGLTSTDTKQLQVVFMTGLFLSLSATLFAEGRGWNRAAKLGSAALAVGFVALVMYWAAPADAYESPAFYLLGPGAVLLMTVAPFLHRGGDNQAVWNFNLASWVSALFGLIVALALGLGLTAILGGLETLFGFNIHDKIYEDAWIICMSVVWPWQTLAGVPGGFETRPDDRAPRWADYLVSLLLVPLALIYLGMLAAFSLMILVQWELPRGTIGWMVGIFGAYGVAVWSAAHPLRETGNPLVRLYHRYFHFALFVPVLLLAVGVGARISEYGITEKRYALILLTLWLAGIALYGVLRRPARLTVAPASFAALLILGSFGPWGATSVSIRSQLNQLESMLSEAGILIDGKIVRDEGLAGPKEVERISSIVRYLGRGDGRDDLEEWLENVDFKPAKGVENEALLARMGLGYVEEWEEADALYYSVARYGTVDVAGFEVVHELSLGANQTDIFGTITGPRYRMHFDGRILTVTTAGGPGPRLVFDLDALAEALRPLEVNWDERVGRAAMTLDAEQDGLRVRVHLVMLSGQRTSAGNEIDHVSGVLLVGKAE